MAPGPMVTRIVSGGQTGVDRAALDVALDLGVDCGGWVPLGRRTEDGPLPEIYPLRETASADYVTRTRLNVRDSDATLILTRGKPSGGTALTVECALSLRRPHLVVDLNRPTDLAKAKAWLTRRRIRVLNVAGPRESSAPGIHRQAVEFLKALFQPS